MKGRIVMLKQMGQRFFTTRGMLLRMFLVVGIGMALLPGIQAQETSDDPSMQNMAPGGTDGADAQQPDPPSQVARISVIQGNVSVEPASVNQFSAAEGNYPLTTGDRLWADDGALAEIQTDQLAVRLGQQTDLTVTAMTDTLAQFGLAQGSVHLRSFSLDQGTTLELDTPNVAVTVLQPGDVRVDVDPTTGATTVMLISGSVEVDGNGLQQTLEPGQRVRLGGGEPVSMQWLYAVEADGLDSFSSGRDSSYQSEVASEGQYVNPETIGAEDLSANGDWDAGDADGPVWYPSGVVVGWAPYSCGHWTWIAPWGWTWVDCARWGFAPFHYGRWSYFPDRHRWGWRPGPPVIRPIYSPALVVFVGGVTGVTAWFPLGPHEPFVPWYHASPRYLNRVNVSGIYNRNTAQVKAIYNQKTLNPAFAGGGDRSYTNRSVATTVVSQAAFAAGRPVAKSTVRVNADQLAVSPVLPHPLVTPDRAIVTGAPARGVPVRIARPTLETREESGARAGAPQTLENTGENRSAEPAKATDHVSPVVRMEAPAQQPAQPVAPVARPEPTPAPMQNGPTEQQRTLYNRAVPPAPRPSFDEQQKAIESTDPGRPLSPVQMQNIRQSQPVGPARQPEAPHPAQAPKPVAPPRPEPSADGRKH